MFVFSKLEIRRKQWLAKIEVSIISLPPLEFDSKIEFYFEFELSFGRK